MSVHPRNLLLPVAAVLLAACSEVTAPAASDPALDEPIVASVRVTDPQIPTYADLALGYFPEDDGWVAIVFVRPPSCVRSDFNLLLAFDVPAAFGCSPMTVTGHAIFADASHVTSGVPPRQAQLSGTEVPVWLAPAGELQAAAADGMLTIDELGALPGLLRGTAYTFNQTTKNSDASTGGAGSRPGSSTTTARGEIEDGRTFSVLIVEKFLPGSGRTFLQVRITVEHDA